MTIVNVGRTKADIVLMAWVNDKFAVHNETDIYVSHGTREDATVPADDQVNPQVELSDGRYLRVHFVGTGRGTRRSIFITAEADAPARNTATADKVIDLYRTLTNSDDEDIVADLLGDLMHWCDAHPDLGNFNEALRRAEEYHSDEATDPKPGAE